MSKVKIITVVLAGFMGGTVTAKVRKAPSAGAASKGTDERAGCRQRAQVVGRALRKLADLPDAISATRRFQLVRLEGARYAPRQLEISIERPRPDKPSLLVTLEGSELAALPDGRWGRGLPPRLVEHLKLHWRNWQVTHPGERIVRDLLLAVHEQVRWEVIVGLLRSLGSIGVSRVGLLVAVSDPSPPMPPSGATAAIKALEHEIERGLDPRRKAPLLGTKAPAHLRVEAHWKRAVKDCPQAISALDRVGGVAPGQKGRMLAEGIEEALIACRCQADIPTIHARLHMMLHRRPTGVVWFRFDSRGRPVSRAASEPWRQTVDRWLRGQPREIVHGRLVAR